MTKHQYEARLRAALHTLATPPEIQEHTISDRYSAAADELEGLAPPPAARAANDRLVRGLRREARLFRLVEDAYLGGLSEDEFQKRLDAFTSTDAGVPGALRALKRLGYRVPTAFGVAGSGPP